MAITGSLFKIAFGGRLFATESWSCSLHLVHTNQPLVTASGLEEHIGTWLASPGNMLSNAAILDFVKFNVIDPVTGKYVDTTGADTFITDGVTTGNAQAVPGQLAAAASLTTALSRGRGHVGRIYAPAGAAWTVTEADGQCSSTPVLALGLSTAAMLNSINQSTGGRVVVFSKIGQVTHDVTGVKVGRVLDTQRRRRSSLAEEYIQASTIVSG